MEKPSKQPKKRTPRSSAPKKNTVPRPEQKSDRTGKSGGSLWGISIYLCLAVVVLCLIFASCNGGEIYSGTKETASPTPAISLAPAETAAPDDGAAADPDAAVSADPNTDAATDSDATPDVSPAAE